MTQFEMGSRMRKARPKTALTFVAAFAALVMLITLNWQFGAASRSAADKAAAQAAISELDPYKDVESQSAADEAAPQAAAGKLDPQKDVESQSAADEAAPQAAASELDPQKDVESQSAADEAAPQAAASELDPYKDVESQSYADETAAQAALRKLAPYWDVEKRGPIPSPLPGGKIPGYNRHLEECKAKVSAVWDTMGKACIDFIYAASSQHIYAVTTEKGPYMYCSIPKNGCTYHLGLMQRVMGFDYRGGNLVHAEANKSRLSLSPEELERMIQIEDVEKYLVVRNPLERVLSAYLDKIEPYLETKDRIPASFENWAFEELSRNIKEQAMNPHWRPQVAFCGFKLRDLWRNFRWFRVEEPAEYVEYLEKILPEWVLKDGWNGRANASFREAVLGPRERTGHTSDRFFQYVQSLKLFDFLANYYRDDIERLGYKDEIAAMRERVAQNR